MCAYGKRSRPPVGAPQEVKNALFSNFADKNSRIFGSSDFLSYLCSDMRGTCRKGPRSSTRGTASQSIRGQAPIHTDSGAGVIISAAQRDWNSSTHSPHPKQRCSTPCWDATQRVIAEGKPPTRDCSGKATNADCSRKATKAEIMTSPSIPAV